MVDAVYLGVHVPAVPASHRRVGATVWPARRSTGGDAALWASGGVAVLALAVLVLAATREPGGGMLVGALTALVLAALATALFLWAWAYRHLTYTLGDQALDISWFGRTLAVPYTAIDGIYTGQRLVGSATPIVPAWPGIYVGPGRARAVGRLGFFTTSPDPAALTLITLEHGGVVVSARNPHEFRLALIERIQDAVDAAPATRPTRAPARGAPWTALFDRWLAWSLLFACVALFAILAVIGAVFEFLPPEIALRFDANGDPSLIAPREDLLRLPLLGLLVLLVDVALGVWLHARERLPARLLWLSGAVVQTVLLVAVIRLVQ